MVGIYKVRQFSSDILSVLQEQERDLISKAKTELHKSSVTVNEDGMGEIIDMRDVYSALNRIRKHPEIPPANEFERSM